MHVMPATVYDLEQHKTKSCAIASLHFEESRM